MRVVVNIAEMLNKLLFSLWGRQLMLFVIDIFYKIGVSICTTPDCDSIS